MLFSSILFYFTFLPVVLVLYYLIPAKGKNIGSAYCQPCIYAWGEPVYVVLMILSICLNYFCGREIQAREDDPRRAKRSIIFAVVINILILGFFKYYGFVLNTGIGSVFCEYSVPGAAPAGGNFFYTFQAMSYVIDIYRKKITAQKNILLFALYICMFPKLIAGPIVRYEDIEQQLAARKLSVSRIGQGKPVFYSWTGQKGGIGQYGGRGI